jgi:serine/threonine protein kinase/tetratricopeptide (TPR) repeat protein
MIGKHISHYHILEKLGEGGMGVVYKAEDTKLKRTVALKFLPPELTRDAEAKERFVREAQAASALQHHNICTIHDIDETEDGRLFIVMDYYEGETLKTKIKDERLKIKEVINIFEQIARGLEKAHEKGIVHRDIKPANIFITSEGVVKILDFGLAKLAGQVQLTKDSSTLGTVAYMSPEQLSGKDLDQRSDIWSLGVVLVEMLTGKLPFAGDYEQAIIYSILNDHPVLPPEIPADMKQVIESCLEKNPAKRYPQVENILKSLRNTEKKKPAKFGKNSVIKTVLSLALVFIIIVSIVYFYIIQSNKKEAKITQVSWKSSIAVLPFIDMSPQHDQEYFCDGIAEEILNKLSHIDGLKVIARTSSFQFKGKQTDITEIGQKLDVSTILEGSVRKAGKTLRITAQLINVKDQSHIWSNTFDRELKDILFIQDEIAFSIVDHLRGKLLIKEKNTMGKRYTQNLEAYQDFLKGRYRLNKLTLEDMKKSVDYFNLAIEKDPDFALAYCGLAHAYDNLTLSGEMSTTNRWQRIETEANKAINIDDKLSEAFMILGDAQFLYHWNWDEAERLFNKSIELNPGNAIARNWYAQYLSAMGRHEQAINEIKIAHELDPLSVAINLKLHVIYLNARLIDLADQVLLENNNLFPNHPLILLMNGYQAMVKKKYQEAVNQFSQIPVSSIGPIQKFALAQALAFSGKKQEALDVLKKVMADPKYKGLSESQIAKVYIALEDYDQSFKWLNKAFENRDSDLVYLAVEMSYDQIHNDQRYYELLKRMGFPE